MASYDGFAFGAAQAPALPELYCADCQTNTRPVAEGTPQKLARNVTAVVGDDRCGVCGAQLARRNTATTQALPHGDISMLMNRLLEAWGIDPTSTSGNAPASEEAVAKLSTFSAGQAATTEVGMIVDGIKGEVILVPANFGPCKSIASKRLVVASPFTGASALSVDVADKIVLMERGVCTFAAKVLRAQAAGAVAVIVVQTADVWPYTMTDSKGEGATMAIPAFMISAKQGKGLVKYLAEHEASATIDVRLNSRECVICQVDIANGSQVIRMPCQHMFHSECLGQWLNIRNSCPICRVEIASKHGRSKTDAERDFLWSDWMS
ncbi:hypothetical protein ACHHYP_14628 [Achlya hypogyna]|uniref:RING-type domain-containing protein n=1 Tax=Achlya hypogyna TaxID=1202772 RepID=A0A1V9ZF45_ACHHY|nr:hypothetical protein ACHHYP_14628 [Achlya hypogyna]